MTEKILKSVDDIEKSEFYKSTIVAYNDAETAQRYADTLSSYRDEFLHDYVIRFCQELPKGARILDIGCGTGIDVGFLRDHGYEAYGIDVSERMIQIATDNIGPFFSVLDARNLNSIEHKGFDAVMSIAQVLHIHPSDLSAFFIDIHGVLKERGKLLIGTKAGSQFAWDHRLGKGKPRANAFYDWGKLKHVVSSAGFQIEEHVERCVTRRGRLEPWILFVGTRNEESISVS